MSSPRFFPVAWNYSTVILTLIVTVQKAIATQEKKLDNLFGTDFTQNLNRAPEPKLPFAATADLPYLSAPLAAVLYRKPVASLTRCRLRQCQCQCLSHPIHLRKLPSNLILLGTSVYKTSSILSRFLSHKPWSLNSSPQMDPQMISPSMNRCGK